MRPRERDDSMLLPLRIIVFTLAAGACAVLVVARYLGQSRGFPSGGESLISFVSAAALATMVVLRHILLRAVERQGRAGLRGGAGGTEAPPDEAFHGMFRMRVILGAALFEGPSLLGGVAYLLEGSPVAAFVAALGIVLTLKEIPTRAGLEDWLQTQRRLLRDEG